MQYHWTIAYDSDEKRWFLEQDPTSFYPDGNVWDENKSMLDSGWFFPEEGSPEEKLDNEVYYTLRYLMDTFPTPKEA
jgi:hypothetical protein